MGRSNPASKTIRNIGTIAMRRDALAEIARAVHRARIIKSSGNIEGPDIAFARLVDTLSQPIPVVRASGTLAHHASDDVLGAGILHDVGDVAIAGGGAVVVLHQTGVADTEV